MDAFKDYLDRKCFCSYKIVPRSDKIAKIPCNLQGTAINIYDSSTCITLREVIQAKKDVGICFSGNDLVGIDLDKCYETDFAYRIIDYFRSYTEVSVSGTGYHIIIRVPDIPAGYRSSRKLGQRMQVFCNYGYFALTFKVYKYKEIAECPFDSLALFSDMPKEAPSRGVKDTSKDSPPTEDDLKGLDRYLSVSTPDKKAKILALFDCNTIEKVRALRYTSFSEADMALVNYLVYGLRDKASALRVFIQSNLWNRPSNNHPKSYLTSLFDKKGINYDR